MAEAARFVLWPGYTGRRVLSRGAAAIVVLAAMLVHAGCLALVVGPLWLAARASGVLPAADIPADSLAASPLAFLVIAPLLEELLFRGWLTGRAAALRFAGFGFGALALLLAGQWWPEHARALGLAGAATAATGLVWWGVTRRRDTAVPRWFAARFAVIVWGSAILFGLIHLGNFRALESAAGLVVVAPQVLGGMILAYVRTRLGLASAIAYHAGYNALFVLAGG